MKGGSEVMGCRKEGRVYWYFVCELIEGITNDSGRCMMVVDEEVRERERASEGCKGKVDYFSCLFTILSRYIPCCNASEVVCTKERDY